MSQPTKGKPVVPPLKEPPILTFLFYSEGKAYYMSESFATGWMRFMIPSQQKATVKPGCPKIIMDGVVIPDKDITMAAAHLDITMMYAVAVRERTEWQCQAVMDSTGLVIEKIWTETQEDESIMVLVPKPAEH